MKPSWFARDELLADGGKNVVSEERLVYRPEE